MFVIDHITADLMRYPYNFFLSGNQNSQKDDIPIDVTIPQNLVNGVR